LSRAGTLDGISPVILGGGQVPFRRYKDGSGFRDWVRAACDAAFEDARTDRREIDAVVVACETDFLSMQLSPGPLLLDEIGIAGRPVVRVEAGGGSGGAALRMAVMHVLSGLARRVLVIGFEQAASHLSADTVRAVYGLSFDADLEGWAGATATMLYALSVQDHMARFGTTMPQLAQVSVKNHCNACLNPLAHAPLSLTVADVLASPMVNSPYRRLDCSLISDGAAALILAHPGAVDRRTDRPLTRVIGSGCATDAMRLGDRPSPGQFLGKRRSAEAAYRMAGLTDPARQIDVAEVYDSYSGAEVQGIEALLLAPDGTAADRLVDGCYGRDGVLPVNLSGGLIGQGGAPGATGLAQAITISRLLEGRYHAGLQSDRQFRTGLIDCHGGVATVNLTHVLERLET
jgi:acetyl-CoA C-acetyltransferase